METFFADPSRASEDELRGTVVQVVDSPLIESLMKMAAGLFAVLNEKRQVLSVNQAFLKMLGISDPGSLLGLRPGQVVHCVHADAPPAGCGTTRECMSCGAAIAIVAALGGEQPVEKTCALTVDQGTQTKDLFFQVRACPLHLGGHKLILLFLQDQTNEKRWAHLERVFYHDLKNTVTGILGWSELLLLGDEFKRPEHFKELGSLGYRLAQQLAIQSALVGAGHASFNPLVNQVTFKEVVQEIQTVFQNHPAARNKVLQLPTEVPEASFATDMLLLLRVLGNMIVNACEASEEGDQIRVWFTLEAEDITFSVWNRQTISPRWPRGFSSDSSAPRKGSSAAWARIR